MERTDHMNRSMISAIAALVLLVASPALAGHKNNGGHNSSPPKGFTQDSVKFNKINQQLKDLASQPQTPKVIAQEQKLQEQKAATQQHQSGLFGFDFFGL